VNLFVCLDHKAGKLAIAENRGILKNLFAKNEFFHGSRKIKFIATENRHP